MPDYPDRSQLGAVAINGFSIKRWKERGCITSQQAILKVMDFHHRVVGNAHVLFTGYNA